MAGQFRGFYLWPKIPGFAALRHLPLDASVNINLVLVCGASSQILCETVISTEKPKIFLRKFKFERLLHMGHKLGNKQNEGCSEWGWNLCEFLWVTPRLLRAPTTVHRMSRCGTWMDGWMNYVMLTQMKTQQFFLTKFCKFLLKYHYLII